MKKIITSHITSGVGLLPTKNFLDHIQQAYTETISALALGGGISSSSFTVLYGCVNTGTYPTFTISAGAIYYNGEIYIVDAVSFNAGSDTAVGTITTTYSAQDPSLYTDQSTFDTYQINKIVFAAGVSGSADIDFGDLVFERVWKTYVPVVGDVVVSGGTVSSVDTGSHIFYYKSGKEIKIRYHILCTVSNNNITQFKLNMGSIISAFDNGTSQPNGLSVAYCQFGTNPFVVVSFSNNNTYLIFDLPQGATVLASGTVFNVTGEITIQLG